MRIAYWIVTVLAGLGLFMGGLGDAMRAPMVTESLNALGYPVFLASILGFWKIAGALTILLPGMARLKEWAYAGFFFVLTGAATSHIVVEQSVAGAIPALSLLVLVLLSYFLRPEERKLPPAGA